MKIDLPKYVADYLAKFEYKRYLLYKKPTKLFNIIIVIPAIAEHNNIVNLIKSLNITRTINNNILIIFVVNNLVSSKPEIKDENYKTIELLKNISNNAESKIKINFIDAATEGNELPEKDGGVGLARKIGMDTALNYFDYSQNTLLVCLDADCEVSENYFEILDRYRVEGVEAGYIPFEHRFTDNEEENLAIICYDIFLNYYVAMLKYANSPFAFHTIGSTMVCSVSAYCKIQGMNKRLAAEDFYFMEKLAKLYPITVLKEAIVYPLGRSSWRVPFGTGQRVARYLTHIQDEYILYNTEIFKILKSWHDIFFDNSIKKSEEYLSVANKINNNLYQFLLLNNFENSWNKIIVSSKSDLQILKQKKFWFDGFRTLKLVHFLRDNGLPNIKMKDALDKFCNLIGKNFNNSFETKLEQMEYLKILKDYILG